MIFYIILTLIFRFLSRSQEIASLPRFGQGEVRSHPISSNNNVGVEHCSTHLNNEPYTTTILPFVMAKAVFKVAICTAEVAPLPSISKNKAPLLEL